MRRKLPTSEARGIVTVRYGYSFLLCKRDSLRLGEMPEAIDDTPGSTVVYLTGCSCWADGSSTTILSTSRAMVAMRPLRQAQTCGEL